MSDRVQLLLALALIAAPFVFLLGRFLWILVVPIRMTPEKAARILAEHAARNARCPTCGQEKP